MNANIVEIRSQVIMVKNIVAGNALTVQWLEKNQLGGLTVNHLKEIGQDLVNSLKNGESWFIKEITIPVKNAVKLGKFMHTIKLNGLKMKQKDLMLKMELHYVLNVMERFMVKIFQKGIKINVWTVGNLLKENPNIATSAQLKDNGLKGGVLNVIIDRMRKLDPGLVIKKNGEVMEFTVN